MSPAENTHLYSVLQTLHKFLTGTVLNLLVPKQQVRTESQTTSSSKEVGNVYSRQQPMPQEQRSPRAPYCHTLVFTQAVREVEILDSYILSQSRTFDCVGAV